MVLKLFRSREKKLARTRKRLYRSENKFITLYRVNEDSCTVHCKIPGKTLKKLHNLIYNKYPKNEIVANLEFVRKGKGVELSVMEHTLTVGGEDSASPDEKLGEEALDILHHGMDMHSHPPYILRKLQTTLGYPSSPDYATIIQNWLIHKMIVHFLLAPEGIYVIQLTPEFMEQLQQLWDNSDEYKHDTIIKAIQKICTNNFNHPKENFKGGTMIIPSSRDRSRDRSVYSSFVETGEQYAQFINNMNNMNNKKYGYGFRILEESPYIFFDNIGKTIKPFQLTFIEFPKTGEPVKTREISFNILTNNGSCDIKCNKVV